MAFSDEINQAIKDAMRAKDKVRLSTLRDIKSKIMVEATSGSGNAVGDDVVLKICMKLFKQRKETYELYIQQERPDLAKEELDQSKVIEEFLPKMLSEEEIRREVKAIIKSVGASGPQDMGKCMGVLTKKLAGKADGKIISSVVRDELANR
ncbi:MAG: GatB/YqeY domain-containing protein [Crocinitomicaceae bacterium]|tara:strand:- start:224 stop:676 length:453 start_codon:yes stop_codon:yes gene_type:complete